MPKIKIIVNEFGQPVGDKVKRFTRAIGCLVRRKLSVGCADWRLVDGEKKFEVWTYMKVLVVTFSYLYFYYLQHITDAIKLLSKYCFAYFS